MLKMQIQRYGSAKAALCNSQGPTVIHSELSEGELCPEHSLACGPQIVKCLDFGALRLLTSLLFLSEILKGCRLREKKNPRMKTGWKAIRNGCNLFNPSQMCTFKTGIKVPAL